MSVEFIKKTRAQVTEVTSAPFLMITTALLVVRTIVFQWSPGSVEKIDAAVYDGLTREEASDIAA